MSDALFSWISAFQATCRRSVVGDGKEKNWLVRYFYLGLGCSEETAAEEEKMGAGVAGGPASSEKTTHLPPLSFLYQSLLVPPFNVLASVSVMRNLGDMLAKALLSWQ